MTHRDTDTRLALGLGLGFMVKSSLVLSLVCLSAELKMLFLISKLKFMEPEVGVVIRY